MFGHSPLLQIYGLRLEETHKLLVLSRNSHRDGNDALKSRYLLPTALLPNTERLWSVAVYMNISDCNIRTYACMFVTRLISKKLNVVLFVIRARRGVGGVRLLRPLSRLQLLLQLAVLEGAGRGARARGAGRGRGARLAGALAVSITVARTAAALPPLSRRRRDVESPRARTRPAGCYTMLARCALPK